MRNSSSEQHFRRRQNANLRSHTHSVAKNAFRDKNDRLGRHFVYECTNAGRHWHLASAMCQVSGHDAARKLSPSILSLHPYGLILSRRHNAQLTARARVPQATECRKLITEHFCRQKRATRQK
jgi:hypothetical protein